MISCKEYAENAINRAMDPGWVAPMKEAELVIAARQADALEAIDRTLAAMLGAQVLLNERLHAVSNELTSISSDLAMLGHMYGLNTGHMYGLNTGHR